MAVSLSKINSFVENLALQLVNLNGSPTVALTNTAHTSTWDELADLTQVSYTNLSARAITITSVTQTTGTLKAIYTDLVLTASGAVGPFQYVYVYDDASTGDKLLWYYDYGSPVTMASGDTFTIDFDATNGVVTIA